MKLLALAAILFIGAAAQSSVSWTNCALGPPTDMRVDDFTLAPYPLCIGQSVCATATGTLSTDVTSVAWITLAGKYLGRQVYCDSQNVCILLYEQGRWCPIPTTMTSVTICLMIKGSILANVDIELTINVTNGNNHILFCRSGKCWLSKWTSL